LDISVDTIIHNVFHVSLLKKVHGRDIAFQNDYQDSIRKSKELKIVDYVISCLESKQL